jgi:hypothetical protein
MHVMLDLETLSTRPDAVILTMGAIKFDPHSEDLGAGIHHRVDVDEQIALGRHVDDTTVDWWGRQAADVREEALSQGNRISLEKFTVELNRFIVGADCIWAQGPVFDIVILENLYRQLGKPVPWNYWQIRDSRTIFGVFGDFRNKNKVDAHNALADCAEQARALQHIYGSYKIVK